MKRFIKRLRNISLVLVLLIWQVVFAGAPIFQNSLAHAAPQCVNDTAGANDVPNQKDLTKLCIDYAGSPVSVSTTWNWDDSGTQGANSMDACNLFDTDGDGFINYAVCVTTQGNPAAFAALTTYSCSDKSIDTCSAPNSVVSSGTTSCTVNQSATDPFPAGDDFPNDTQGSCTIDLSTVGGSSATLVDVCSYESSSPTSNPSDCVIAVPGKAKLEVIKELSPDSDPGLFDLKIDGTTYAAAVGDGGNTGEQIVTADSNNNTHVVLEAASSTSPTTLSNYDTSVVCKDQHGTGSTLASGSPTGSSTRQLSVDVNKDSDVVCTFTNTRQNGTITVTKVVNNNHGGTAKVSDFPLFVNSTQVTSGVSNGFTANQSYTISETNQTGYHQDSIVCKNTAENSTLTNPFTLASSENVSCTITNSDIVPTLTLVKTVTNDNGGTKQASDFQPKVDGSNVSWATSIPLSAGAHTASEVNLPGYLAGSWGGDCAADGTITLSLGQNATCTITNNDIAPSLTLNKEVINTHGGTAGADDWTLTATGATNLSGQGPTVSSGSGFSAGTYTLSESGGPSGYSPSDWTCTNGVTVDSNDQISLGVGDTTSCTIVNSDIAPSLTVFKTVDNPYGGTTLQPSDFPIFVDGTQVTIAVPTTDFGAGSHTITETQQPGYEFTGVAQGSDCTYSNSTITLSMSIGGTYTCTLVNTAIQPKLTVIKHVVNDNGGTKSASDFTMTVTGNSASVPNFPGDEKGTTVGLNVGDYSADETSHDGYAESFSGDCSSTIALGDTKTCTITNNDIAPSLTLNKIVSNTHGGTAQASDWTITATGPTTLSGQGPTVSSGATFEAGTYTLSESGGPTGYSPSGWSCTNGVIPVSNQITLANGQSTSCTITNSDIAPTLTVTKVVENPYGTALDPSAFPLYVDGIQVTSGVSTDQFNAGSHTVTETQQTGYTLTGVSGDCAQTNGSINLNLSIGQSSTCTLTNTAIQPQLTVIKHVVNDNSGTASAGDFTMTISGNSASVPNFPGDENGTTVGLNEGNYVVGELSHAGYAQTISGDCISSISIGQTKTCTITNNDLPNPGIHIVKSGPAVAHEGDNVTYTFTVTNTGDIALSDVAVNDNVAGSAVYQSGDTNGNHLLDTSETWIFTKDYTIPAPQISNVVNTGTACGNYSDGVTSGTDICASDTHTLDVIHPSISVQKYGPATAFQGQTVTYSFWVTNTGDTTLNNVGIADDLATGETCDDSTLAAGDYTFCTAAYTIPNDQTGDVTNHVTASGTDILDETVTGTDQHTLTVLVPSIHVVKTGPGSAAAGSTVTYTFTVTNTGNAPLDSITVQDNIAGTGVYQSGDTNSDGSLDMNETWIYTANYTIPKDQFNSVTNTVTACGTATNQQDEELELQLDTQSNDNNNRRTVCAEASHTLTIPKVLAETTPPKVLANTGQSAWAGLVAGLTMLTFISAITYAAKRR
jgi:uncharacterized repeat protein (TIGR01451 family)